MAQRNTGLKYTEEVIKDLPGYTDTHTHFFSTHMVLMENQFLLLKPANILLVIMKHR